MSWWRGGLPTNWYRYYMGPHACAISNDAFLQQLACGLKVANLAKVLFGATLHVHNVRHVTAIPCLPS